MVSLDVVTDEEAGLLKRYADLHGFNWRFATAPKELLEGLSTEFGNQFLNPPSEPMLIIDPRGGSHLTPFGRRSPDRLVALVDQYK